MGQRPTPRMARRPEESNAGPSKEASRRDRSFDARRQASFARHWADLLACGVRLAQHRLRRQTRSWNLVIGSFWTAANRLAPARYRYNPCVSIYFSTARGVR